MDLTTVSNKCDQTCIEVCACMCALMGFTFYYGHPVE